MSIQQNFPSTRPSLNLNFARSQKLDPRITFTRTSSATRVNSDGLIEVVSANSPRFDFDPISGESLGLLVEEQRTNLYVFSENPESAFFQPELVSFSSNSAIAPDGNLTADKIISPVGANGASISQGINISSGATLTGSAFVKYADLDRLEIVLLSNNNTTPYARATINPINGTITTAVAAFNGGTNPSASVVSYGNGWYRFSVTVTYPAVTLAGMRVATLDSGGALGDGTKGTFVWGMQLEVGSFPTSYIPTSGSTATRTADNARITGSNFSDFYNPEQGTITCFAKSNPYDTDTSVNVRRGLVALFEGSQTGHSINLRIDTSDVDTFSRVTGFGGIDRRFSHTLGNNFKSAASYTRNDLSFSVDGRLTISISSTENLTSNPNQLVIGRQVLGGASTGTRYPNTTISQITYYPTALPQNQLQTLTK
jgi:hypothetical protein